MDNLTQWAKINEYLREHESATLREMYNALNINWPAKRISEMRDAGVKIGDFWCEDVDADGHKTQYKRYFLA